MKIKVSSQIVPAQVPKIMTPAHHKIEQLDSEILALEEKLRDVATPSQMQQWIIDICKASDLHRTAEGDFWESPNWDARLKGWKEVSMILGFTGPKAIVKDLKQGNTQILIQVVDNRPEADQKEIPAK